jgi:hypothetical protein
VHDGVLHVVPRWVRALWLLHSDEVWAAYAQADQDDEVRRVWSCYGGARSWAMGAKG